MNVLEVCETKASQAWRPAVHKVAAMIAANPAETLAELAAEVEAIRQADFEADLPMRIAQRCGGRYVAGADLT